jgi:membrane fusion protein, multidrug efflux system
MNQNMRSRNKYLIFLLIPTLCINAACSSKKTPKLKETPPTVVDVMIASTSAIDNNIEANGTIIANEFVELRPEISGRVTALNVPEGSVIQKGTVIAKINDADLQAQLSKTKVLLALAQKTEERYKQLIDVQGINQSDYDIALNAVNGYKADMVYTQALIDKTVIRAPFSGKIGLRQISPGAYVTSTNIIATIQQVDKIKIDFTLPEEYRALVQTGFLIHVKTDVDTNLLDAKIIATEPQVIAASRNLKVRAVLQNSNINPGAFVKVYINSNEQQKGILIPSNCIIPNDKSKQVVVVRNNKASLTNIKTGWRQSDKVAVTEGLKDGDTVVITGVLFAKEKAAVKIRSIKKT